MSLAKCFARTYVVIIMLVCSTSAFALLCCVAALGQQPMTPTTSGTRPLLPKLRRFAEGVLDQANQQKVAASSDAASMSATAASAPRPNITAFYSPSGGCTQTVVSEINAAKKQVLVQAYSFTSKPIAEALIAAKNRGINVLVLLDKTNELPNIHTEAPQLIAAGVLVLTDAAHAIAHNKVMLIDGQTVITGSFNFTQAAEHSNAENLLVIRHHPTLYQSYSSQFTIHQQHSRAYQPQPAPAPSPAGGAPRLLEPPPG